MSVVLDLETCADDRAEIAPVKAPSNYTKPESIAAYIAEETPKRLAKRSLDPWSCRMICAGWVFEGDTAVTVQVANSDAGEVTLLKEIARVVDEGHGRTLPVVTFNGRGFDLPVLMARARLLGVSFPRFDLRKYGNTACPDLLVDYISFGDTQDFKSLQWCLKRFGLPYEDIASGAHIAAMYEAGDWPAIKQHCEADVTGTRLLGEALEVLRRRSMA